MTISKRRLDIALEKQFGKAMYITTEAITTLDVRTYAWVRTNYLTRTGPAKTLVTFSSIVLIV